MKALDFEPTTTEIFSAAGAALLAIVSTLPPQHRQAAAQRLDQLAGAMEHDRDTNVAKLCRELARMLAMGVPSPH